MGMAMGSPCPAGASEGHAQGGLLYLFFLPALDHLDAEDGLVNKTLGGRQTRSDGDGEGPELVIWGRSGLNWGLRLMPLSLLGWQVRA